MAWPNQFAIPQYIFEIKFPPFNSNVSVVIDTNCPFDTNEAVDVNWFRIEKNSPITSGECASDII